MRLRVCLCAHGDSKPDMGLSARACLRACVRVAVRRRYCRSKRLVILCLCLEVVLYNDVVIVFVCVLKVVHISLRNAHIVFTSHHTPVCLVFVVLSVNIVYQCLSVVLLKLL